MGLKISQLLRWKTSIILKDELGAEVKDEKGKAITVYMRVVGDEDLQRAYKLARIESAAKRKALRDETSIEFKDQVEPIREASREDCLELIKTARSQNFSSEAYSNTERPDDAKIEEIATDPDAPTLEEQEKLDAENARIQKEFDDAINSYIETKLTEIDAEFATVDLDNVRSIAELEVSNITSLALFLQEVLDQKIVAACYVDKDMTERAFDSVEDYRVSSSTIKSQISEAYMKLELGTEQVKN